MGKEKASGRHNTIWSAYGIRIFFNSLLFKSNNANRPPLPGKIKGFTLVEALVSVGIIMILSVSLALVLNPQRQLDKSRDSTRLSDITQIRIASDAYYDDKNCYPDPSTIPFGQQWKDNTSGTVYMTKVPQDPEHSKDSTKSYLYQTDGSGCSQWNVIYGRLAYSTNKSTTTCPLEQMANCLPPGYASSSYNYCVVSGTVDCNYISSTVLPGLPTIIPTPVPSGGPSPTPTPTMGTFNICHTTEGNSWQAMNIPSGELQGHLGHGDFMYSGPLDSNGKPTAAGDAWCVQNAPSPTPTPTPVPCATWYKDADGDGQGNPSISTVSCTQPATYVSNNNDCYDSGTNAASAFKGQTLYFATPRGDGSFDYDCDGNIKHEYVIRHLYGGLGSYQKTSSSAPCTLVSTPYDTDINTDDCGVTLCTDHSLNSKVYSNSSCTTLLGKICNATEPSRCR